MAKGFPWYKDIEDFLRKELEARRGNNVALSRLKPWVTVTSNLGKQYTIGTESYHELFGGKLAAYNKLGTPTADVGVIGGPKYLPNPLLTEFSIDFSARGTLRTGNMKIKCFSLSQLEEVQKYFLEPSITIFAQWGWNHSLSLKTPINKYASSDAAIQNKFYRNYTELDKERAANAGCYDNLIGIITGGQSTVQGLSYEVTVKFATNGELLYGIAKDTNICKDPDKKDDILFDEDQLDEFEDRAEDGDMALNWALAFNNLTKPARTTNLQHLGNDLFYKRKYLDFINMNKDIIEEAKEDIADSWASWGGKNINFFGKLVEAQSESSPVTEKQYMSFYAFCEILNKSQKVVDANNKNKPLVKIDLTNSYCAAFKQIFSPSSDIFIPNINCYNFLKEIKNYETAKDFTPSDDRNVVEQVTTVLTFGIYGALDTAINSSDYQFDNAGPSIDNSIKSPNGTADIEYPDGLKKSYISFPREEKKSLGDGIDLVPYTYGWVGDIYISMDIVNSALDNVSTPIKDILDGVLSKMSAATNDFWSFQVLGEQDDPNTLVVVDNTLRNDCGDPCTPKYKIFTFNNIGVNSDFIDSSLELSIPKAMMSKVVMQKATGEKEKKTTELVGGIFSNEVDSIIQKPKAKCEEIKGAVDNPAPDTEKAIKDETWKSILECTKLILRPEVYEEDIDAGEMHKTIMPGIFLDTALFNAIRGGDSAGVNSSGQAYTGRPLPVQFSFTLLGLSGFKTGDLFRISGLPSQYNKKGAFQVEEVKHKIDDKLWTTEVSGHFRPFGGNNFTKCN